MDGCDQSSAPPEIAKDIYCPVCGYNLYGAPGDKCPECGHCLANLRSPICQIPWERRKELGRFRAYWRTVWMVTFRNTPFCEEYAKSVRVCDARVFKCVSILHVYIPLLLATVVLSSELAAQPPLTDPFQDMFPPGMLKPLPPLVSQACIEVWPVVVLDVCLLLFLAAATSAPSYFFHPRSVAPQQQNSGAAMSYYACGPLAFAPLVPVAHWLLVELVSLDRWLAQAWSIYEWLAIGRALAAGVVVAFWWWNLVWIARRTMPQLKHRGVVVAISVPLLWLGLAVVLLGLLPLAVFSGLVATVSFGG